MGRSARSHTRAVEGAKGAKASTSRRMSYGSRAPSASSASPHRLSRNTHKPTCASAVPPRPHPASPTQCCRLVAVLTGKTPPDSRAARTRAAASSSELTTRHSTRIPPAPTTPSRSLLHRQYAVRFAFSRTTEVPPCMRLDEPSLPLPGSRLALTRQYSPTCQTIPSQASVPATRNP